MGDELVERVVALEVKYKAHARECHIMNSKIDTVHGILTNGLVSKVNNISEYINEKKARK